MLKHALRICLAVASLTLLAAPPAGSQTVEEKPVEEKTSRPSQLDYQLGKTMLKEAIEFWRGNGNPILSSGYMALGTGSGVDNASKAYGRNVVLVDVGGVDFEGMDTARFGFYEERLYTIQVTLNSIFNPDKNARKYSEPELAELEKRLIAKYGQPVEKHRTIFASGKKPDVLVWRVQGNELVYSMSGARSSLVLINRKMESQVQRYKKEACKDFDRSICW